MTGLKARDLSAHNLGVENLLRFVGIPVALASLFLDMLKGFVSLLLFAGHPWAALGVYAGHLYPLPQLNRNTIPRGRGNGILLGVVTGFALYGHLPFMAVLLPSLLYLVLLSLSRFVTLATVAVLASLPLLAATLGSGSVSVVVVSALIFLLALWRHKAGLARILDQTEPKLGDPPPVWGSDPGIVYAAFMVHPLTLDDLWQPGSQRWLRPFYRRGILSEALLRRMMMWLRPQKQGEIRGIRLSDGRELRVMLIAGTMLPDQIRAHPKEATQMAIQGARLAIELGAEAFGLGAFWSTVGNKGLDVQRAVPDIHITNGGAYTAATVRAAVPGLLRRFELEGGSLKGSCAAVVGANGVVAFGVARMIADEVGELLLIGRDRERLERSAETLRRKFPATTIEVGTTMSMCASADLIFAATSHPDPVIFPEHVKPGSWIFDLGRPADVDERVRQVPGVHIVPGGVVRPPGEMQSLIDIHFGDGMVPACMAETMIMTATRAFDRKSLGTRTKTTNIEFYLREGTRLGFDIITRDQRVAHAEEVVG